MFYYKSGKKEKSRETNFGGNTIGAPRRWQRGKFGSGGRAILMEN